MIEKFAIWGFYGDRNPVKKMKNKPTHGGTREGAGRKPRDTPREAITVRIEREDAARLREICAERPISQAAWITEQVRNAP